MEVKRHRAVTVTPAAHPLSTPDSTVSPSPRLPSRTGSASDALTLRLTHAGILSDDVQFELQRLLEHDRCAWSTPFACACVQTTGNQPQLTPPTHTRQS